MTLVVGGFISSLCVGVIKRAMPEQLQEEKLVAPPTITGNSTL